MCSLAAAWLALGGGCNFSQSGIEPPTDRIFLPAGIVPDPDADLLYVVNSNSDLRFNAGTIAVVNLAVVRQVRAQAAAGFYQTCSKTRFSRTEAVAGDFCCRDLVDSNVTDCSEPQFIQSDATVSLGSFASAIRLQRYVRQDGEVVRRLFVAVRAEPSITFADVTVSGSTAALRCTGPHQPDAPAQSPGAFCDDNWKLRRPAGATPGESVLAEEPHALLLDEALGILYVGHLTVAANNQVQGGGVSSVDVCAPEDDSPVRFAGLARTTFLPAMLSQAVAELSPGDPANPRTRLYATARNSAAISGLVLKAADPAQKDGVPTQLACTRPAQERDLTLVPSDAFYSPAFLPHGTDIRGVLFSADGSKAYVLHRNNTDSASNPAALVVLDRTRLADGNAANTPLAILQVCSGPTAMQRHDAGRGERIYVTCYEDGQIYVIDPGALVVVTSIDAGTGPASLVFSPADPGIAYLANFANSHLSVIDLQPGSPTENHTVLRIGLPHGYGE
jgi:YVTN family beta-propeller protein